MTEHSRTLNSERSAIAAKWRPTLHDMLGAFLAVVQGLPMSMALGMVVFAPLGLAHALDFGVKAGLVALIVGGLIAQKGGAPLSVTGPRAAGTVVLAGLVAFLVKTQPGISPTAVALAVAMCLSLSALIQATMATLRAERLIERLPEPVVGGFTMVIGVYIVLDQLTPMLLGHYARRPPVWDVPMLLAQAKGWTPVIGLAVLALLIMLGKLPTRWKRAQTLARFASLIALAAGIAITFLANSTSNNPASMVPTLAAVMPGFDPSKSSWLPSYALGNGFGHALAELSRLHGIAWLLTPAALLAAIHSLDALTTARMLREKHGAEYNASTELWAQSAANLACGLCGGTGVTASPGLSLAMATSGADGVRGRLLFSVFALTSVMLFWDAVALLPVPVMGAMVAAMGIKMVQDNWHHMALHPLEWAQTPSALVMAKAVVWFMLGLALFSTVPVLWIVGTGVLLITAIWVYQSSGKLVFRQYSGLQRRSLEFRSERAQARLQELGSNVQIIEVEGDLFFGTAPNLREAVLSLYRYRETGSSKQAAYLLLDFSRLDQIDASGVQALTNLLRTLSSSKYKVEVWLSYVPQHPGLGPMLNRSGLAATVPKDRWAPDSESALEAIEDLLLADLPNESSTTALPESVLTADLPDDDKYALRVACEPVQLQKHEVLFEPGDAVTHVYWLMSGDLRLSIQALEHGESHQAKAVDLRHTRQKRLAVLNPGTWLGLDALISSGQGTRPAKAYAHTSCKLMALPVSTLKAWKSTHPKLAANIFEHMSVEATERLTAISKELAVVDA